MRTISTSVCLLLVLVILESQIQICAGIWCFQCHSFNDPACGDDFRIPSSKHDARTQCDGPYSCVKRRGKRNYSQGVDRVEIERTCIPRRAEGCYTEVKYELEQYSCSCNSDFCNSSPKNFTNSRTTVVLCAISTLLFHLGISWM